MLFFVKASLLIPHALPPSPALISVFTIQNWCKERYLFLAYNCFISKFIQIEMKFMMVNSLTCIIAKRILKLYDRGLPMEWLYVVNRAQGGGKRNLITDLSSILSFSMNN